MTIGRLYPFALALLLVPAGAQTQQTVERSRAAAADGVVEVENVAGSIRVEGWDRNEVAMTARLGRGIEGVEFEGDGSSTRIRVAYPRRNNSDGADLVVRVPAGSRIKVQGVSATVVVQDLRGPVDAQSVSGDVTVSGSTRTVQAASVSGDVRVNAGTNDVRAQSVSGDVHVQGATGFIEAETTSGNVGVQGREVSSLSLHSVSGRVSYRGSLHATASVNIESFSGTVDFAVPSGTAGNFEASTFSGSIDNEFNDVRPRTERRGPGSELEFSTGDRGAQIELSSFSGTIRIRGL
ncbi:MAG TPA: DUF4097 family beta strand repeat-containing protein [Longimicrobiales bacterium]|nr:DUF4097 family beta strand repeat-containing protein [Longimicrobiales bacterium]